MATLNVTTKSAEQVWQSPDKKITIFKLGLEYEGKPFNAKTYSKAIATEGWSGEVETYEKSGRNGSETFVKQAQKEGGWQARSGSKREQDPFTMYLSYAKDLAVAMLKDGKLDEEAYGEVLEAVIAGGKTLYEARPSESKPEDVKPEQKPEPTLEPVDNTEALPL